MRYSTAYIPTLKDAPAEAELASHRLLLRAGMLRQVARGIYDMLPLGLRVQRKIERIIRDELERAGAHEVLLPVVQPAELWKASGRWDTYAEEGLLATLQDRNNRELCLGPTHEEVITDLVRRDVRSYRDLPLLLYQIQTKFRDEIRPRFGLLRAREFTMMDAYSFDRDEEAATAAYRRMYDAYVRIFQRCGLACVAVEALTGSMGGNLSHEFQVLADGGENEIAQCPQCGYAANVEKAEVGPAAPSAARGDTQPAQLVLTPGKHTVEDVAAFLNVAPTQIVKTLIYETNTGPVAALVRGDHAANDEKLRSAVGATWVRLAEADVVERVTGAPVGFAGPIGLDGVPLIADQAVQALRDAVAGANTANAHYRHVQPGRDFLIAAVADIRSAVAGDPCPRCDSGRLTIEYGIEVGQVYYLGTRYSVPLDATFLDENGQSVPFEMGCYGIGVGRTMAAAVEQHHDASGMCWPMGIAPFQVLVLPVNEAVLPVAERLYADLIAADIEALYDDRDERAGVKFKDADLLGIPLQLVIGDRGLQRDEVELKWRRDGSVERLALGSAAAGTAERVKSALSA